MKPENPEVREENEVQTPKKNGQQQRRNPIIKSEASTKTDGAMAKKEKSPGIDAKAKEQDGHANHKPIEQEKAKEQDGHINPKTIKQEETKKQDTNDQQKAPA